MAQLRTRIGVVIVASLILRIAIAPRFHGFQYDMFIYGNWAETLVKHPLNTFYDLAESPDHLPGDLYIHWILGHTFQMFGGADFQGATYRFILKAFPALIDCLLAWFAYRFVRSRTSAASATLLGWGIAFSPAIIFLSSVWGQWDTVSLTILLAGLILLWSDHPRLILASSLFGWALLIKPPLLLLVLPMVAGLVWSHWQKGKSSVTLVAQLTGMVAAATVTVSALMYPFGMTWLDAWGDLSLQGQLQVAAELYPHTTLGAANIWMIPLGSPNRVSDTTTFLGVSLQNIGLVLMLLAVAWTIYRVVRAKLDPLVLIWAMTVLPYAYFMLPTRSHERYLFPAVIMLAILATLLEWRPWVAKCYLATTLVYFINLVAVYRIPPGAFGVAIFEILSVTNVIIFIKLMSISMDQILTTRPWPPGGARTGRESHPAG